jgi:hypothetical protein
MPSMTTARIAIVLTLIALTASVTADTIDPTAYQRCQDAASTAKGDVREAIAACAAPAAQGVPGAQYALGALLLNAGGDTRAEGMAWLEKAVASGHTGAAYLLARVVGVEPAQRERAKQLMTTAACGDYPVALDELKRAGMTKEQLHCPARADADFTGEWSGPLQWVKISPAAAAGPQLKVVISEGKPSVFFKRGDAWMEVKPGKFTLRQVEQTAVISVIESGSDFDGVWIEAWDIHLLRLNADEAMLSYMRTVNNRDLPASIGWRTFSTVAEGRVRRAAK